MKSHLTPVIHVDADKCVNCHQCIQVCPVKFCNNGSKDYIELNSDLCIGCGACLDVCQHEARIILDDFPRFLEDLKIRQKLIAFVAPAVAANFPDRYLQLNGWLKQIGVSAVFDVSFGAELTVKSYLEHIKQDNPRCVIAQPCPALVTYVQIYKPDLIPHLAPADSPMMHTMKMVREYYPEYADFRFVIISPCIAKRREFDEVGLGDYNITMQSVEDYLVKRNIDLGMFPPVQFDNPDAERAVLFSTPGGLMRTAEREMPDIVLKTRKIEGNPAVYHYFDNLAESIRDGEAPLLVDCLNCEKGCNGGTGAMSRNMPLDRIENRVERRAETTRKKYQPKSDALLKKFRRDKLRMYINTHWKPGLYARTYRDLSSTFDLAIPDEAQLNGIYQKTYKTQPEDFLHCSSCGYDTCEQMAVALFNSLTKPENCRHYQEYMAHAENRNVLEAKEALAEKNRKRKRYIKKLNEMVNHLQTKSEEILSTCETGITVTKSAVHQVDQTSENMQELHDATGEIHRLLEFVNDVVNRIHVLGLNAGIESAKAGEAGLGFQVIVREIRALTQSSNREIDNIAKTLSRIIDHAQHTSSLSKNSVEMISDVRDLSIAIMDIVSTQNEIIEQIVEESNQLTHQGEDEAKQYNQTDTELVSV